VSAGTQLCRAAVEQTAAASPIKETCCCCAKSADKQCPSDLKGGCGQNQSTSDKLVLLSAEAISVGLSPSPAQTSIRPFTKEGSTQPIFFRETVYLINVKFLC